MPKIILERHAHAPELNRAHVLNRAGEVKGVLPCPGVRTIHDARALLFHPHVPGVFAVVTFKRSAPWAGLDSEYRGRVATRADALRFARAQTPRHAGGVITITGESFPSAVRRISCQMV